MPNRWPISSGNWSNAAIWSGSIIPTASDDVYANTFNVTINQNININSLNTSAITGVTAGGTFISTDGISITASRSPYGLSGTGTSTAILTITGSHTVYFTGSIQGSPVSNIGAIRITNGGILYYTGSIIGGAGGSSNAPGIYVIVGTVNVLGTVFGSGNSGGNGIALLNGSINSQGVLNGSAGGAAIGLNGGSGSLNHSGSIIGTTTNGVSSTSTGNITVTGSVYAGAAAGINSTTAQLIVVAGSIYSSNGFPGLSSTSTTATVRVTGPLISSQNNINPVFSPRIQLVSNSTPTYTLEIDTFPREVTFYDVAFTSSLPAQTNVRSGSLYGGSAEFSGSMIIPSTSSVRYGVPVDNITGSATLTPQDILNYATQNLTGSNSIGARLKNIATTQTTAATIAAFKGK
jgi:hypothetical protein